MNEVFECPENKKFALSELEEQLQIFVRRAAKKTATPEEVSALPSAADVLLKVILESY